MASRHDCEQRSIAGNALTLHPLVITAKIDQGCVST